MLKDLKETRREKLKKITDAGLDPYPARVKRTHTAAEAHRNFSALLQSRQEISLAGRVTSIRDQGKVVFIDIKDESGKFQVVLKSDNLKNFDFLKLVLDRGDFISASGAFFKTEKGEESIEVKEVLILSKSLNPYPDEWFGLENIETRLRKRYLDLLINSEVKEVFKKKDIFWNAFREYLMKEGFLEVETPALEIIPGGADAEPFKTHHNALDTDFYLRISLELPLKKLLVAGFEKVFEIGRIFRNEGIDREHLQDYTQLEFYWAYHDYSDLMFLVEDMYKTVIKKVTGGLATICDGKKIDWSKKWPRIHYVEAFQEINKLDPLEASRELLFEKARSLGLEANPNLGRGRLIDLIFKKTVRPTLVEPAFLIDPPVELVPLTKRSEKDRRVGERMQPVACGTELGTGFTELNDPLDQRKRFEEQERARAAGDKEAQRLDEDYLEAMEYGMPPAAGFGVSERLFSVLMDKPIRETVIFPLMRSKQ